MVQVLRVVMDSVLDRHAAASDVLEMRRTDTRTYQKAITDPQWHTPSTSLSRGPQGILHECVYIVSDLEGNDVPVHGVLVSRSVCPGGDVRTAR